MSIIHPYDGSNGTIVNSFQGRCPFPSFHQTIEEVSAKPLCQYCEQKAKLLTTAEDKTAMETISTVFSDESLAYFKKCIHNGYVDLAIKFVEDLLEIEREKLLHQLDSLERRIDKLENVQVTRREFEDIKRNHGTLKAIQEEIKRLIGEQE